MNEGTAEPLVLLARMELAAAAPKEVTLEPLEVTAPERLAFVVTVAALPLMEPWIVAEKVLVPLQVFVLARRVVLETVMSAVPLKETPLMRCAVWSWVAVAALPPMESEEVATCAKAVPALLVYMRELPLTEERPVPPFAIATMPVTFVAVPPMLRVEVLTKVFAPLRNARTVPGV
jgi:hypothetical protein